LEAVLAEYQKVKKDLNKFEEEHRAILKEFKELIEEVTDCEKSVRATVLEHSDKKEAGKHVVYLGGGYEVRHKITAKRQVDAEKLLKKFPRSRTWKGLYSVSTKEFDAAIAAGVIEEGQELVSFKPTNSVEIVET
jgi:hypothetical protein